MCHLQLIFMPKIDVLQHLAFVVLCVIAPLIALVEQHECLHIPASPLAAAVLLLDAHVR